MSEEMKNTPIDPLAPEIPEKAKIPETPTTRVEQQLKKAKKKAIEYKKDIKFLWIYSSVFCLVALALIGGGYVIQEKIHAQVDDYKTQAESATQSDAQNKSLLSNIQEKNKQLQNRVAALETENETLKVGAANDEVIINKGEEIILQQNLLMRAILLYEQNNKTEAKEVFSAINKDVLPADSAETYAYYEERLN